MRLLATHSGNKVIIVEFLYEGADNENLKAVYIDDDGAVDADDASNFTIEEHERVVINGG
jgi:hypothetical protein